MLGLCAALWALTHCAASRFYQDAFQGTRGAVDALRRSGPDVVDPGAVRELTEAAARGAREGMNLPTDLDAWAAQIARHAVAAAVMGVADGLQGGLSAEVFTAVDGLTERLGGERPGRGLAGRVLADATPGIEGLTRAELAMLRHELSAMLRDTRLVLGATTLDMNTNLQTAVRANGEVLSHELERELMPALGRGLARDLAPAMEVVTRRAALGATRGLQDGLRGGLSPALMDLRESLIHGPRSIQHTIWALSSLVFLLVVGISTLALLAWRAARKVLGGRFNRGAARPGRHRGTRFKARKVRPSGLE